MEALAIVLGLPIGLGAERPIGLGAERPIGLGAERPIDLEVERPIDREAERLSDRAAERPSDLEVEVLAQGQRLARPAAAAPTIWVTARCPKAPVRVIGAHSAALLAK